MGEIFSKLTEPREIEPRGQILEGQNVDEVIEDEVPPSLYEQRHKEPFSAKMLDIKFKEVNNDTVRQLKVVDDYINKEIKEKDFEDSEESYKFVLNELMNILGINMFDNTRISKLSELIIIRKFINVRNNG